MRKPIKNILTLFLCALFAFSIVGCGGHKPGQGDNSGQDENKYIPGYTSEYNSREAVREAALELNEKAFSEGVVLLKNKNNALPLTISQPKVTIFGKNSINPVFSGVGSSGATEGETFVDLYDGLIKAGFKPNPSMRTFYKNDTRSGSGRLVDSWDGNGGVIGETRATGDVMYNDGDLSAPTSSDLNYDPLNTTHGYSNYESVRSSYASYNDAAIVFISRTGQEGTDNTRRVSTKAGVIANGARTENDHYLELNLDETNMIKEACAYFDNVIVIINSAMVIETGFLDDPTHYAYNEKIKAALWMATPGENGFAVLPKILKGEINPSGRTVDMYYRNFENDPTFMNIGKFDSLDQTSNQYTVNGQVAKPTGATQNPTFIAFVDYQEDIYFGYRYYETRFETEGENGASWYKENVVFPFGYGLSYTDFTWEVVGRKMDGSSFNNSATLSVGSGSKFTIDVKVTNTGSVAGQDVVEIYGTAPYKAGGIEKASKVLVGYEKTKLLAPNESQTVSVEVEAYHLASYDCYDKNCNGFKGYELESGNYKLNIARNSHDTVEVVNFNLDTDVKIDKDTATGSKVENIFEESNSYMKDRSALLSRQDNFANYDELTSGSTRREATQNFIDKFGFLNSPAFVTPEEASGEENCTWGNGKNTAGVLQAGQSFHDNMAQIFEQTGAPKIEESYDAVHSHPEQSIGYNNEIPKFYDMFGAAKDDQRWDVMVDSLTWKEISSLIGTGVNWSIRMDSLGKPEVIDQDGPLGWVSCPTPGGELKDNSEASLKTCSTCLIAATFNRELAQEIGEIMGEEALWAYKETTGFTISGWYAPGGNIHRSPFGGRNFEYMSEDAYLTGNMVGEMAVGCANKGVYAYMKHFFLNDQETDRFSTGLATWASEQNMRENYARAFEIAVKRVNQVNPTCLGIMSAYNRIGTVWCSGNYAAMNKLLRNEWGFDGIALTDYIADSGYQQAERAVIGGNCKMLQSNRAPVVIDEVLNDPTWGNTYKWMLHNTAKQILYVSANSNGHQNAEYVTAASIDLNDAKSSANGVAPTLEVGTPVNYDLQNDVSDFYKPVVHRGDRSKVTYTYSLAPGSSLPAGLTLTSDGKIVGTPTETAYSVTYMKEGVKEWSVLGGVKFGVYISASTTEKGLEHKTGYQEITLQITPQGGLTATNGPLLFEGGNLGTIEQGVSVNQKLYATKVGRGTTYVLAFRLAEGSTLPQGLELSSTGAITGVCTSTEAYTATFTVEVYVYNRKTNEIIDSKTATFTFTIRSME